MSVFVHVFHKQDDECLSFRQGVARHVVEPDRIATDRSSNTCIRKMTWRPGQLPGRDGTMRVGSNQLPPGLCKLSQIPQPSSKTPLAAKRGEEERGKERPTDGVDRSIIINRLSAGPGSELSFPLLSALTAARTFCAGTMIRPSSPRLQVVLPTLVLLLHFCFGFVHHHQPKSHTSTQLQATSGSTSASKPDPFRRPSKGKLLVLGGTGFLGNNIACRAILEGYSVTSLSRRGLTPSVGEALREATYSGGSSAAARRRNGRSSSRGGNGGGVAFRRAELKIDYRKGDARDVTVIRDILNEGGYTGILHAVGLLFDGTSGLTQFNRLASGSGSQPGASDTYDEVTRITAFNAIDAAEDYVRANPTLSPLPFVFSSAAEAGWAEQRAGQFVESRLTPGWMKRYLGAKRAVESRLIDAGRSPGLIRPIIFRSSLIYSLDKVASLPATSAFFLGNRIGLPFVDRPVTVQALGSAMLKSISQENISGIQKFTDVDRLSR